MKTENCKLISNVDGLALDTLVAVPDKEPLAVVVMHHGMAEHKERYLWLMERLAKFGFASVIFDMRGHGKSIREENDLGYFYQSGVYGLVLDYHQVSHYARERFPDLPVFLFGHSMGALIVRDYLQKHDFLLAGVVLSGAPCRNGAAGSGLKMVDMLAKTKGDRSFSKMLDDMCLGGYDKAFKGQGKNAWLATDTHVVEAYNDSPLCGFSFTVDGYRALMESLQQCYERSEWEPTDPDLPILFMAGSEDPVIGNVKKYAAMVHFLRSVGYDQVTGKLYSGMRHEIFQDVCREGAVKDMVIWMKKILLKKNK